MAIPGSKRQKASVMQIPSMLGPVASSVSAGEPATRSMGTRAPLDREQEFKSVLSGFSAQSAETPARKGPPKGDAAAEEGATGEDTAPTAVVGIPEQQVSDGVAPNAIAVGPDTERERPSAFDARQIGPTSPGADVLSLDSQRAETGATPPLARAEDPATRLGASAAALATQRLVGTPNDTPIATAQTIGEALVEPGSPAGDPERPQSGLLAAGAKADLTNTFTGETAINERGLPREGPSAEPVAAALSIKASAILSKNGASDASAAGPQAKTATTPLEASAMPGASVDQTQGNGTAQAKEVATPAAPVGGALEARSNATLQSKAERATQSYQRFERTPLPETAEPPLVPRGATSVPATQNDGAEALRHAHAIAQASTATTQAGGPPAAAVSSDPGANEDGGRPASAPAQGGNEKAITPGATVGSAQVIPALSVAGQANSNSRLPIAASSESSLRSDGYATAPPERSTSQATVGQLPASAQGPAGTTPVSPVIYGSEALAVSGADGAAGSEAKADSVSGQTAGARNVGYSPSGAATPAFTPSPVQQVATAMLSATTAATQSGSVDVSLYPEELGRVRLFFAPAELGLTVLVQAERSETLDMLRRNIELLGDDLRRQGFGDVAFEFGGQGNGQQGHAAPTTSDDAPSALNETTVDPEDNGPRMLKNVSVEPTGPANTNLDLRL